jgi:hypothetical protein
MVAATRVSRRAGGKSRAQPEATVFERTAPTSRRSPRCAGSPRTSSATTTASTSSSTTPESSGRYFDQLRESRANEQAYADDARRRLWELSEELAGL